MMILRAKKYIFIFLLFSSTAFSQASLIDYCINFTIDIKPFRDLKISKITITCYEIDGKKIDKFSRADKVLYTYDTALGVLKQVFVSLKDKPIKGTASYYKADSQNNLYWVDEKGMGDTSNNVYEFDEHQRVKKGNGEYYFYDDSGKLIKTSSIPAGQNAPRSYFNITEYEYKNDTLVSKLSYRDYGDDRREAGKFCEYIYENGKLKGYKLSEKYFISPKEPILYMFEIMEDGKTVKRMDYINNKLRSYCITKFGE